MGIERGKLDITVTVATESGVRTIPPEIWKALIPELAKYVGLAANVETRDVQGEKVSLLVNLECP